jgi:superfamily II DNA or RNA helicase
LQQPKPGDLVRVRQARWRIAGVRPYDGCRLITLAPASANAGRTDRHVLAPFDLIEPAALRRDLRVATPRRWRRTCRQLLAANGPPASLRTARGARIDLLPHQLEPALAVLRGLGCRLLLADDVGLGKTVQAALICAELAARGAAERVLILTPAGLRDQWTNELRGRFYLPPTIVDAVAMRRRTAQAAPGVNPWDTTPMAIASIDYVKRPEVLPAVAASRWDVVVIDEAHNVARESERYEAAATLAGRAAYVLLLTATPHSGDRGAFDALRRIGALTREPLLVFRRTAGDVGIGRRRRIHRLLIRPSAAEALMHAALTRFASAVRKERGDSAALGLSVLEKRALSSAHSLAESVTRREAALAADGGGPASVQFALPWDAEGELDSADAPPPWSASLALADRRREVVLLRTLAEAARDASTAESKIGALRRLLRRTAEPAIVFTEYRDTLFHLRDRLGRRAVLLHGGLDRRERAAALAEFVAGGCPLLLATDAAAEGLNLHHTCRLVINLELPWNPTRLEQRIGRVDRIGQRRTVHAVHLIARRTTEARILRRLKRRVAAARLDIRAPDPVDGDAAPTSATPLVGCVAPDLAAASSAEASRLAQSRRCRDEDRAMPWAEGPWLMRARHRVTRQRLRGATVLIFLGAYEDPWGRLVEWTIVPIALDTSTWFGEHRPSRRRVADRLRGIDAVIASEAARASAAWRHEAERLVGAFTGCRLRRERAIAASIERPSRPSAGVQPGLFDRRAATALETMDAIRRFVGAQQAEHVAALERSSAVSFHTRLLLAITP